MKKHIMLDLETMGIRPDAAIIAIGAVVFDHEGTGRTFYIPVQLQSSMDNGGTVDASTIIWWMKQPDAARQLFSDGAAVGLNVALLLFKAWLLDATGSSASAKEAEVWGNGADFDNVILASAYRNCGIEQPWGTFKNRCYRTFRQMVGGPGKDLPRPGGTAHHAMQDALYQARNVVHLANACSSGHGLLGVYFDPPKATATARAEGGAA